MSLPTKPIEDVLKNAQEVTSLASTDRLAVIGEDGTPKKATFNNAKGTAKAVSPTPNSPQWIRIAEFTETAAALLCITSQWGGSTGSRIIVDLLMHTNSVNYNKATVLSVMRNSGSVAAISKCRVVNKTKSKSYLDIYYTVETANIVSFELVGSVNITPLQPILNAQIPEGYFVKEFDLTTVGGGVNRYSLASYAIIPKGGGLRDDADERFDQLGDKRCSHRSIDVKRLSCRFRFGNATWHLSSRVQYCDRKAWKCLRSYDSGKRLCILGSSDILLRWGAVSKNEGRRQGLGGLVQGFSDKSCLVPERRAAA